MHSIDPSGKAAFTTGGTSSIGRAIAQRLTDAGAGVAQSAAQTDAVARLAAAGVPLFYRIDDAVEQGTTGDTRLHGPPGRGLPRVSVNVIFPETTLSE